MTRHIMDNVKDTHGLRVIDGAVQVVVVSDNDTSQAATEASAEHVIDDPNGARVSGGALHVVVVS